MSGWQPPWCRTPTSPEDEEEGAGQPRRGGRPVAVVHPYRVVNPEAQTDQRLPPSPVYHDEHTPSPRTVYTREVARARREFVRGLANNRRTSPIAWERVEADPSDPSGSPQWRDHRLMDYERVGAENNFGATNRSPSPAGGRHYARARRLLNNNMMRDPSGCNDFVGGRVSPQEDRYRSRMHRLLGSGRVQGNGSYEGGASSQSPQEDRYRSRMHRLLGSGHVQGNGPFEPCESRAPSQSPQEDRYRSRMHRLLGSGRVQGNGPFEPYEGEAPSQSPQEDRYQSRMRRLLDNRGHDPFECSDFVGADSYTPPRPSPPRDRNYSRMSRLLGRSSTPNEPWGSPQCEDREESQRQWNELQQSTLSGISDLSFPNEEEDEYCENEGYHSLLDELPMYNHSDMDELSFPNEEGDHSGYECLGDTSWMWNEPSSYRDADHPDTWDDEEFASYEGAGDSPMSWNQDPSNPSGPGYFSLADEDGEC